MNARALIPAHATVNAANVLRIIVERVKSLVASFPNRARKRMIVRSKTCTETIRKMTEQLNRNNCVVLFS